LETVEEADDETLTNGHVEGNDWEHRNGYHDVPMDEVGSARKEDGRGWELGVSGLGKSREVTRFGIAFEI
jgi:hypothetical protein